jgi:hypothetical protein
VNLKSFQVLLQLSSNSTGRVCLIWISVQDETKTCWRGQRICSVAKPCNWGCEKQLASGLLAAGRKKCHDWSIWCFTGWMSQDEYV